MKCTCATLPFHPSFYIHPSSSFQSRYTGLETKRDARNTRLSVCKQSRRLRRPHCTPFERNDTVQNEAEQRETLSHGSGAEREWNIEGGREREAVNGGRCRGVLQVRRGSKASTLSDFELPKVNFPRLMRLSHNRIFPIRWLRLFKGLDR